jgi:hypothetical protein
MSSLIYNSVQLEVVESLPVQRRVVYDGPVYLYTMWRIHVRAYYNPFATSYTGQPGQEVPDPGATPALTDETVRHKLMQPRGKLVFTMGGPGPNPGDPPNLNIFGGQGGTLVILDCPPSTFAGGPGGDQPNYTGGPAADQYFTDAANGPRPVVCVIRRISGFKTWHVEFVIEAAVNECFSYYSSPAVILSQRWTMRHDIDRMGFTRRTVRGHAIFRSDVLLNIKNANPDDFREALLHPIPNNCERQNIMVEAHEDGLRVDYSFVDVEVSHMISRGTVARLEAFARVYRHRPSLTDIGAGAVTVRNLWNLGGAIRGALPTIAVRFTVRAWGNRNSSRVALRNVCTKVLQAKLPSPGGVAGVPAYTMDNETIYDIVGRYVEMSVTMVGGVGEQKSLIAGGAEGDDVLFPDLIKDDIAGVATVADTAGRAGANNNFGRGTYLEACVAQALQGSCRNPGTPLNVPTPVGSSSGLTRKLPQPGT